jgi:hypothetical protein
MTKELSATRKADREQMARLLMKTATAAGGEAEIKPGFFNDPREVRVEIVAPGGIAATVSINGDLARRYKTFVVPWHISHKHDSRMSYHMTRVTGAEVNPFHRAKCTAVANDFNDLLKMVYDVVAACKSGRAYEGGEQE